MYDEALRFYQDAVTEAKSIKNNEGVISTQVNYLAGILFKKGDYDKAEPLYRDAISIKSKLYGQEHPKVTSLKVNLASLLRAKKKYQEAYLMFRKCIKLQRNHQNTHALARTFNSFALCLKEMGRYEKAEKYYNFSLEIRRKLPRDDYNIAETLGNLGVLIGMIGDYKRAEPYLREALAIKERINDKNPSFAIAINNLAKNLWKQGHVENAEKEFRRAISILETTLGNDCKHPCLEEVRANLTGLLKKKRQHISAH